MEEPAAGDRARRNVLVLAGAQAFAASGPPVIVSLGGMVGQMLASDKMLATLPVSLFTVGVAAGTLPVAMLLRRIGRRPTYLLGSLAGIAAGLLAAYGIVVGSFVLFCCGTALAGINGACVQSYRFAAIESSAPVARAGAISKVMMGGLAAAIIGPQIVIWTRNLFPGVPFAGGFLGQSSLAFLALLMLTQLHAPRVEVAHTRPGRPLGEIARSPRFAMAVATGVVSYALMSFVMTAAPIAMVGCGHTIAEAALGIQWHVLAMYAPSFVTGRLIGRFGEERVALCGLLLLAFGAILALSGLGLFNFWGTLVLLGVGWNFGFIGASSIVIGCARPEERARVQGLNDFLVFGSVAVASLMSGNLVQTSGWPTINWFVLSVVAVAALFLAVTVWGPKRAAARPLDEAA